MAAPGKRSGCDWRRLGGWGRFSQRAAPGEVADPAAAAHRPGSSRDCQCEVTPPPATAVQSRRGTRSAAERRPRPPPGSDAGGAATGDCCWRDAGGEPGKKTQSSTGIPASGMVRQRGREEGVRGSAGSRYAGGGRPANQRPRALRPRHLFGSYGLPVWGWWRAGCPPVDHWEWQRSSQARPRGGGSVPRPPRRTQPPVREAAAARGRRHCPRDQMPSTRGRRCPPRLVLLVPPPHMRTGSALERGSRGTAVPFVRPAGHRPTSWRHVAAPRHWPLATANRMLPTGWSRRCQLG